MLSFKKLNDIIGWAVGILATVVYAITAEETASFWDCGEFIAVSYKLMVPHPPGAPFFLLIGRLFSFLALGDVERVAFWITMVSVLSSGMTILFLFWTITLLGKKVIGQPEGENGEYTLYQQVSLLGASTVGALAYTFSDSFWFSAVEAEVYGMSSFFTAFVVWAMLKWETIDDPRLGNRWLLLIIYMMGLSIGVHLLNLVTIPALALIYYYKKYPKPTLVGNLAAMGVGLVIIAVVMEAVIPGLPSVAGKFEVLFVNSFGFPFGWGALFFTIAFIGTLVWGIRYSERKGKITLNTILLGFSFILIGYSSYLLVLIRSNFQPPIDENDPENIMSFVSYLKREQYGYRPLLYGQIFTAERIDTEQGAPRYRRNEKTGKYEIYDYETRPVYDKNVLLPRMYSQGDDHPQLYRSWSGLKEGQDPTFFHNMYYMLRYQIGHMYFRYFLWNFAGRDSDDKEAGWLLPWAPTDLSESVARNKAHDNFFMLPLLLGLLGVFFHLKKDDKRFAFTGMLFILTGIALVVYMNSPPVEPRERDYIYVGSFYVFAIWIGMGVLAVKELFEEAFKMRGQTTPAIAVALCLGVPSMMAVKGWDNHNRSDRFHSVDQARNTLRSCAPNAILFTGGDNDTFPLWYVQEVEGFRTDVRVIVLSYFSTDWYVNQMKRKVYQSEPLPIALEYEQYKSGKNEFVPYVEIPSLKNKAIDLKMYMRLVKTEAPDLQVELQGGGTTTSLPSKNFMLDVNRDAVIKSGIVPKSMADKVSTSIQFGLREGSNVLYKSDLMILDILANFNWNRPVYFNNTSAHTTALNLDPYLHMEGMTYRLLPVRTEDGDMGVNTDVMYENIKKFEFRGFENPNVYHDEEYRKFAANMRSNYFRLAYEYYLNDRFDKAEEVLDMAIKNIPDESIPFEYYIPRIAELYYLIGEDAKANAIAEKVGKRALDDLSYISRNNLDNTSNSALKDRSLLILNQLSTIYRRAVDRTTRELTLLDSGQTIPAGQEAKPRDRKTLESNKAFFTKQHSLYDEAMNKYFNELK
jgi:tetratricopeptide (TPR) repeat protein